MTRYAIALLLLAVASRNARGAAAQRRARRDVPRHRPVPPQVERHDDPARAGPREPGVHVHGRLPRRLAQRGAGQHRLRAPARAHDLQQVDRELRPGERPQDLPGSALRRRRRLRLDEHDDLVRPDERLLDAAVRQARARDEDRGRPPGPRAHPRLRAAVRDVGRAQRVRDRREQSVRARCTRPSSRAAIQAHPYHWTRSAIAPTSRASPPRSCASTTRPSSIRTTPRRSSSATSTPRRRSRCSIASSAPSQRSPHPIPQVITVEPPQEGERRALVKRPGTVGLVMIGYMRPGALASRLHRARSAATRSSPTA